MSSLFSLEGIDFRYNADDPIVLEGLSLQIPAGKVTAILGPNGTGKTTLLHIMLGVLKPDRGKITLAGKPHQSYSRQELSRLVGLVPQFESIPFNFTVFEYALLGRSPYLSPFQMPGKEDLEIVERALETAGISHLENKPVMEISGGERQLVQIARVLAQRTSILLLDEPTAHLDLENQSRILNLLKKMSNQGESVVMTTHDPNAAIFGAEYFVLMKGGSITACGSANEVITSQNLSRIYHVPIRVEKHKGYPMVVMDKGEV
jgi:iron complex transport system ATP-binding protein